MGLVKDEKQFKASDVNENKKLSYDEIFDYERAI